MGESNDRQKSGTFWVEDKSKVRVATGSAFAKATADRMPFVPRVGGVGARVPLPQEGGWDRMLLPLYLQPVVDARGRPC